MFLSLLFDQARDPDHAIQDRVSRDIVCHTQDQISPGDCLKEQRIEKAFEFPFGSRRSKQS
jgi:hypothetical protein